MSNFVKSIWFYNCELDILPSGLPIKDDYYQIEMISLIDWFYNKDSDAFSETELQLGLIDKISETKIKKNLKFINIRGKHI